MKKLLVALLVVSLMFSLTMSCAMAGSLRYCGSCNGNVTFTDYCSNRSAGATGYTPCEKAPGQCNFYHQDYWTYERCPTHTSIKHTVNSRTHMEKSVHTIPSHNYTMCSLPN